MNASLTASILNSAFTQKEIFPKRKLALLKEKEGNFVYITPTYGSTLNINDINFQPLLWASSVNE